VNDRVTIVIQCRHAPAPRGRRGFGP
jgi:hypothetical protein